VTYEGSIQFLIPLLSADDSGAHFHLRQPVRNGVRDYTVGEIEHNLGQVLVAVQMPQLDRYNRLWRS
jgi:hypothetical protein